ncbi:MAG: B-box zinc finger protein [Spirochaetaceae bacterium]|jgi:hypothetical protein|nr:B-box zinc finger protein [Spirochaetaceae bacterium]
MSFSDGNTTIHHRANMCVNHSDREGRNLCVDCGQWFCDECMSTTHKYLCRRCAEEAVRLKRATESRETSHFGRRQGKSKFTMPLTLAGLFLLTFLLRRMGIGLIALPIVFFLFAKQLFAGRREMRNKQRQASGKIFSAQREKDITNEQLSTLLRIGNGRVTAEKLARAADVDIKTAKKFLDKQVVENILDVEAGEAELVYLKKDA